VHRDRNFKKLRQLVQQKAFMDCPAARKLSSRLPGRDLIKHVCTAHAWGKEKKKKEMHPSTPSLASAFTASEEAGTRLLLKVT
jgi:uncharacterized C2H2 Zn-finger protein